MVTFFPLFALFVTVYTQRKYLFISQEKIAFLKEKVENEEEPYDDFFAGVHFTATRYDVPTKSEWDAFSEVGYRPWGELLPNICLAYLLTDDLTHLTFAHEMMDAMSTVYDQWSVNLGLSHLLFGFSVCFDWLYDTFSASQKSNHINSILLYGDQLFQKVDGQSGPNANNRWFNILHNIINVNAAPVAVAGYALLDEPSLPDSSLPQTWISLVKDIFSLVLEYQQRDGTSQEGIMYYSYELWGRLAYFALEEQFEGVDRVSSNPFFQNTGTYRIHANVPGFSENVMFGDTSPASEWGPDYYLRRLAAIFQDSHLQWLAFETVERYRARRGYYNHGWKSMVWYDENVASEEISDSNTPTFFHFTDSEFFFSRKSWADEDSIFLNFKAGPACGHHFESLRYPSNFGICGAGHSHPDHGSVLLYLNGEILLKDDGYVSYHPTEHHNCVTFGEERRSQYGDPAFQGELFGGWLYRDYKAERASAEISHIETTEDYEYLVANLTRMYPYELNLRKYNRHLLFLKKEFIVLYDEIEFLNGTEYTTSNLHFHSPSDGNQTIVETKLGKYYEYRRERGGFTLIELSIPPDHTAGELEEDVDYEHEWEYGFYESERDNFESLSFLSTTPTAGQSHKFLNVIIPFSYNQTEEEYREPRLKMYKITKKPAKGAENEIPNVIARIDFSKDLKVRIDFEEREVSFVKDKYGENEGIRNRGLAISLGVIFSVSFFVFLLLILILIIVFVLVKRKNNNAAEKEEEELNCT